MLIWKRYGFVVPLLLIAIIIAFDLVGASDLFRSSRLKNAMIFTVYGVVLWFLGKKLNKDIKKELIDKATGQTVSLDLSSTFFFVKVEYWSLVVMVFTVLLYIDLFFNAA